MSAKPSKKPSKSAEVPLRGRADLQRLRLLRDAEIERTSPPELAALPAGFWREAQLVVPVPKQAISLRVDEDVLAWFRSLGPRYQTRMNAVLRSYMQQVTPSSTRRVSRTRRGPGAGAV